MPASYFDLLSPTTVQVAATEPFAQQSARNLAVLPAVNVRPALRDAGQRLQQGQQLELGDRRLALVDDAQDYAQRQLPFEILTGLASGGWRRYGGYRALQQQDEPAVTTRRYLQGQQDLLGISARNNASLLAAYGRLQQTLNTQARP